MEVPASDLILAVAGAGLLTAITFRYLINTVLNLHKQLEKVFDQYWKSEQARQVLEDKVTDLETKIIVLQVRIEEQEKEIHQFQRQLIERDQEIKTLREQQPSSLLSNE